MKKTLLLKTLVIPHLVVLFTFTLSCSRTSTNSKSSTKTTDCAVCDSKGLYSDDYIVKSAKIKVDKKAEEDPYFSGYTVDIVPLGQTRSRAEIFQILKIEETRLQEFRCEVFNTSKIVIWRVSPSYEISMDNSDFDVENHDLPSESPLRRCYNVQISRIKSKNP